MQNEQKFQRCLTFDQFDELSTTLCIMEDAIHKAEILNTEVLNTHLGCTILDPDHPSEDLRVSSTIICRSYDVWRTMLECVTDAIVKAEAALKNVNNIIYGTE